jgi:hypothetical protein
MEEDFLGCPCVARGQAVLMENRIFCGEAGAQSVWNCAERVQRLGYRYLQKRQWSRIATPTGEFATLGLQAPRCKRETMTLKR